MAETTVVQRWPPKIDFIAREHINASLRAAQRRSNLANTVCLLAQADHVHIKGWRRRKFDPRPFDLNDVNDVLRQVK